MWREDAGDEEEEKKKKTTPFHQTKGYSSRNFLMLNLIQYDW